MEMSIAAHRSVIFRFDNKLYFGYVCVGFCMFLCYRFTFDPQTFATSLFIYLFVICLSQYNVKLSYSTLSRSAKLTLNTAQTYTRYNNTVKA